MSLNIHWVWFKTSKEHFNQRYIIPMTSWINFHPNTNFHLWTNLTNQQDLLNFISKLPPQEQTFFNQINIHYLNELLEIIDQIQPFITNQDSIQLLKEVLPDNKRYHLVFKTDYLRLIILYQYGGIYCDLNDCSANTNLMELYLSLKNNQIAIPLAGSEYNNFTIITHKQNPILLELINHLLQLFPNMHKELHLPDPIQKCTEKYNLLRNLIKNNDTISQKDLLHLFNLPTNNALTSLRNSLWPLYLVIKYHLGHHFLGDQLLRLTRRRCRIIQIKKINLAEHHDFLTYIMITDSVKYVRQTNLGKWITNHVDKYQNYIVPLSYATNNTNTNSEPITHFFENTSYGIQIV